MKTASDPRHRQRIRLMQDLFTASFNKEFPASIKFIWDKLGEIDPLIAASAPEWPLAKLNPIDLAILRLAVYELVIDKKAPYKVIIDEAVELAKQFGGDASPAFVNGALGNIVSHDTSN